MLDCFPQRLLGDYKTDFVIGKCFPVVVVEVMSENRIFGQFIIDLATLDVT
jgi:hypothetical protein